MEELGGWMVVQRMQGCRIFGREILERDFLGNSFQSQKKSQSSSFPNKSFR